MDWIVGTATGLLAAAIIVLLGWGWRSVRQHRQKMAWNRELGARLQTAGVSNFFASRADYAKHRGAPKLSDYLSTADKTIDIAAYWMAAGNEAEHIGHELCSMLEKKPDLRARVAIIDPTSDYLGALADYLDIPLDQLKQRLESSLRSLDSARGGLGDRTRQRFHLLVYRTLPVASVVMLDVAETSGRIQLDFKAYRAPRSNSFGFELSAGGDLYEVCRKAWLQLVEEAQVFDPKKHLTSK